MERLMAKRKQGKEAQVVGAKGEVVSSSGRKRGKQRQGTVLIPENETEDWCEGPLKLPNSILDGCESSFKAADEQREKASTKFFDDTALMALVCRHDRVLWLANMTSAGERQHYAIALLDKFFRHVPATFRIGVLYDIGCQLHRSCYKWDLLPEYRDRIVFGISVFHAYGHQWACQITYHPRKCECFGLTDGEGCERVWSALDHLVPGLRVSGYWQRLYVIDSQIHHLDCLHRRAVGEWLVRKYEAARGRLIEAETGLRECGMKMEILRGQWELQQIAQTRPSQRQTQDAGTKTIDLILALQDQIRILDANLAKIERSIMKGKNDASTMLRHEELRDERGRAALKKSRLEDSLDLRSRQDLQSLRKNRYLTVRLNARALKRRIRDRLRQRKFEFTRMERAVRTQSSERKLAAHTTNAVHRREPGIQSCARRYNALCAEMVALIKARQAPVRAVPPSPINLEKLWSLDVDDDIWQDIGLADEEDEDRGPQLWLLDENVKNGIRHMLSADRCKEELDRIMAERRIMQVWLQEEWNAVEHALDDADLSNGLHDQLSLYRKELLELAVTWRRAVSAIPTDDPTLNVWGPTESEMREELARNFDSPQHIVKSSVLDAPDDDNDGDESEDGHVRGLEDEASCDEDVAALYEQLEALRVNVDEIADDVWQWDEPSTPQLSVGSPGPRSSSSGPSTPRTPTSHFRNQAFLRQSPLPLSPFAFVDDDVRRRLFVSEALSPVRPSSQLEMSSPMSSDVFGSPSKRARYM
ncbi:hypothetical protein PUNSTDRAFT_135699 [Punctularia strigosozonata HHB-11173 SS5]|uniref:uncharacterized protein n=1 Tax=Punctularia strigosozonata (strain HHB-11173) TaxID=741275 RepID=UPI0004417F31|nr:uncharacterized protein PUNSTDRAFT_135699 [Punctularia strigosozonata HHB-11173 SS5]EIN07000.1 hypothetical protein PUNSTDRAFT_135699 [Punctularia strigosozonata HHB-11173 SS5]